MAENDPTPAQQLEQANARADAAEQRAAAAEKTNGENGNGVKVLQEQLSGALETTRQALQTANPGLPESAFTGDTFEALNANIRQAQAVEAHVRDQITADPQNKDKTQFHPMGGGVTRTPQMPANLRGITKIAHALNHPGPGMTE